MDRVWKQPAGTNLLMNNQSDGSISAIIGTVWLGVCKRSCSQLMLDDCNSEIDEDDCFHKGMISRILVSISMIRLKKFQGQQQTSWRL